MAQSVKNPPAMQETGLFSVLGRCPGEGNSTLLQYSRLGNPMNKRAWQAVVHGVSRVRHDHQSQLRFKAREVRIHLLVEVARSHCKRMWGLGDIVVVTYGKYNVPLLNIYFYLFGCTVS